MPEHHHGAAGPDLLPLWVRIAWIGVLAAVVAAHAVHAMTMRGQRRGWHLTHLLMGVGMLYMITPWVGSPGSTRAWQYVYAAAAGAVAAFAVHELQAGRRVPLGWLPAGLGLAAMAYMFLLHRGHGVREVTDAFVALHLLEVAAWGQGWLRERGVALSQAAMALAMGYMFLAMDPAATRFFDRAFSGAVTEQTVWGVAFLAVVALACLPADRPARPAPERARTDPQRLTRRAPTPSA